MGATTAWTRGRFPRRRAWTGPRRQGRGVSVPPRGQAPLVRGVGRAHPPDGEKTRLGLPPLSRKVRRKAALALARHRERADARGAQLRAFAPDRLREVAEGGMTFADRIPLRERARGQWRVVLLKVGINAQHLTGKNAPCPMCGGRDRFKFFDTNRHGTWFCRQCSPEGGAGADLVMRFHGLAFRDAAKLIEQHVGALVAYAKPKPGPDPRPRLRKLWADAKPTVQGDIVDTYLRSRGVGLDVYPNTIRTAPSLRYYDDDATSTFPAMLAVVHDLTGKPVTIHRTYIAPDGSGKAPVDKPRKIACRHGKSPHVRPAPVKPTMGIAEGIESALSAMKLFRTPTWSVLSTYGLETFEPPAEIERLIVFADHDTNGAGQKAAYSLAARLSGRIVVEVKFPKERRADRNDALSRR